MHLYEDLKRWAEKFPRKIFLVWRGEALSYSEAYSRVCAIAVSLSPWQGEVLGLRFSDPPSQVLYFLGAMMAGAVPVLLSSQEKRLSIPSVRPVNVCSKPAPASVVTLLRVLIAELHIAVS